MLIDFTVENYRSIKEPVTLSAIAQTSRRSSAKRHGIKPDDEIALPNPVEGRDFSLLPVLAIFGANASGKTNLIQALDGFLSFMAHGVVDEYNFINSYKPFLLNRTANQAPTRFRLRLADGKKLYTYTLWLHRHEIVLERLDYSLAETNRSRLLFEKRWQEQKQTYHWKYGPDLSNSHILPPTNTDRKTAYLTILVRQSRIDSLGTLPQWILQRNLGVSLGNEQFDFNISVMFCLTNPSFLSAASTLISRFDTAIMGVDVTRPEAGGLMSDQVFVTHETEAGPIRWSIQEESLGTQRLFSLAVRVTASLQSGTPLLVDELGSNIHPNITREIVRLFQDPKTNPKRAQLIFTSHDNTLMRNNLLRRDQIWFTQKRPDGSTDLYPLTDFKPRNDLALDKAYLDGRFEAVPILPDTEDLLPALETAA